ncbi:MAG: Spy/CpxP family protein refolding chaperone [Thermodesulfobacteriota bacterium]
MKKTFVVGFGLALGLALVATVALAFGPGFGPWFGRGFGGPPFGSPPFPNLTAEQSAQIQALRDGFLKDIEPLQKELYAKQKELRSLWSAQNPDQAAISGKQKEIANLQSQLQDKGTSLGLEIRKVFTPEQLAKLPAFSQDAGFGLGPGFGPRGFGPGMRGPFGRW